MILWIVWYFISWHFSFARVYFHSCLISISWVREELHLLWWRKERCWTRTLPGAVLNENPQLLPHLDSIFSFLIYLKLLLVILIDSFLNLPLFSYYAFKDKYCGKSYNRKVCVKELYNWSWIASNWYPVRVEPTNAYEIHCSISYSPGLLGTCSFILFSLPCAPRSIVFGQSHHRPSYN